MAVSRETLLTSRLLVPRTVVHRTFPMETVMLNVSTGQYHGLNPVAGIMLQVAETSPSIAAAVGVLVERFEAPADVLEADLIDLCTGLLERGLIELVP